MVGKYISYCCTYTNVGTHDIINSSAVPDIDAGIELSASFISNSLAAGVLFNFIFMNKDDTINFTMSYCLTLNKDRVTHGAMLPLNLQPGIYQVYAYDIESNMRLRNGKGYQASRSVLSVPQNYMSK